MDPAAKMAAQLVAGLARHRTFPYLIVGLLVVSMLSLLAVVFGPWMLAAQLAANLRSRQQTMTDGNSCGAPLNPQDAAAGSFTAEQMGNARTIWTVAQQPGLGDHAAVVGIATALQESGLRNLSYGDRDSVGLFQQRAGWGSVAVRMDPTRSSGLFYAALEQVAGWAQLPVTVAAQAVQRSAFPDAYARHEKAATGLVALFRSKTATDDPAASLQLGSALCGDAGAMTCAATGLPVETGLTPDALRVLRCEKQHWPQLVAFAGVGDRPSNVDRDHQEGRAVDAMIPDYQSPAGKQLGQTIAAWVVANRAQLGVKYVIWNAHIWNVERAAEGWRACGTEASCYSGTDDTAAHRDHVHVSVYGNQAGAPAGGVAGPIVLPVDHYVLTARFGQCSTHWANCHTGLDFAAPTGTSIRAIMSGTVVWVQWGGAYGNLTKIQHPNGVQSWYAHQSSQAVHVGDQVTAGQVIGRIGATGNTTGPHLHLEVRLNGTPVDPDRWLSSRGVAP